MYVVHVTSTLWCIPADSYLSDTETLRSYKQYLKKTRFLPHRQFTVSITKTERQILFREIIAAYCESNTEHISGLCWQNAGGFKADSHIACRAHAVPLPCRAAKGLECVFPIWFTQCGRVWFTLSMPCCAHAMLWPCPSSQGHGTARPSRDGLLANCPRSDSSGYPTEFHEDCYQKRTNPLNDPYRRL